MVTSRSYGQAGIEMSGEGPAESYAPRRALVRVGDWQRGEYVAAHAVRAVVWSSDGIAFANALGEAVRMAVLRGAELTPALERELIAETGRALSALAYRVSSVLDDGSWISESGPVLPANSEVR
jgi:hypothetical protein